MNRNIFKAVDIRGIYPTDINTETIATIGKATAHLFSSGKIIIAHDIRHGSIELAQTLESAIAEESTKLQKKIDIITIGYATTPMFYFLVNYLEASGGCMITASHNPKNYNGIKTVIEGAVTISGLETLKIIDSLT